MTKKEFKESKVPLGFISSINPETGKVLFDTYSYCTLDMWMKDLKKDFPDMIHTYVINKAAINERKKEFGFSKD